MEEESNSEKSKIIPKPKSKVKKFFVKLVKPIIMLFIMAIALFIFWKLAEFIFYKKIGIHERHKGTIDVYNRHVKTPPYTTVLLDKMSFTVFDTKTGKQSYLLSLEIALAFKPKYEELSKEIADRKFEIKDTLRTMLNKKHYLDFKQDGSRELVSKQIKNHLNNILVNGEIAEVYLVDMNVLSR